MFSRMGSWALSLILLLRIHSALTGEFQVSCLQYPILVEIGATVVLECQLILTVPVVDLEIRWTKGNALIHLYRFGQDENTGQDTRYKDRTQLFASEFKEGNVSLKLTKVELADEGDYECFVDLRNMEMESAIIKLNVASLGEMPSINLDKYTGNGIQLLCESQQWFPEPTVEWRDENGKALAQQSQPIMIKNPKSFIKVKSFIDVTSDSGNTFNCLLRSVGLNKTASAVFYVPAEFYPKTSGWLYAFLLIFFTILAFIIGLLLFFRKQQRYVRDLANRPKAAEYLQELQQNQDLKMKFESLQVELALMRMTDAKVDFTLDGDTANPNLQVSSDTVSYPAEAKIPAGVSKLSVLGNKGFTSGKHFWVVEVNSQSPWDLGVARKTMVREDEPALSPENGYWTIGHDGRKYWANDTNPLEISLEQKVQEIGIYINCHAGKVLFCDMATRSHLHTFTVSFEEPIYAFFNLSQSGEMLIS
ncbi:butyrophilin subfamily 1 member A1-like isoform X2 [Carcharodon carcharias]|uniref:butyrophilin subfamily 1 member A1-like isoform X2 n=1 Tax=Carcharodon carcharias TaxID=13397 RepID=UPI001B7E1B60|nr:butyrophilin subfamily 1 member A1-like isoform X2 [Carcharodon carcharias]